jgi:hypothetical protein
MFRHRRLVAALLGMSLVATSSAWAQQLTVSPTVGIYAPSQELAKGLGKQKGGLAVGGQLRLWFSPRLGISATGAYVPSRLQGSVTETGLTKGTDKSTSLWFGSGRLNYWLLPPSGSFTFGVNGGLGLVGRGAMSATDAAGNFYVAKARSDLGGVLGATVGFSLGGLGLSVSADDYIYNPDMFEQPGANSRMQHDLQFSLGVGLPLGK